MTGLLQRFWIVAAGVLGALALALFLVGRGAESGGAPAIGGPAIGGPFRLQDGSGQAVTEASFRGRFMVVYFGYTHCPDVCPATLGNLAASLDRLPEAARARVAPVFITVDPARDTSSVMRDYAHAFGPGFTGLSGDAAAVEAAAHAYKVYAKKHPLK
ncbi:SCO family protein, partial [Stenotrophomonas sp. A3_2]|uniref:SCO family protein n=1 Tax=Stenotrophomonas sp. A3_2 TaxID=3119978 RepID=UPI002FC38727